MEMTWERDFISAFQAALGESDAVHVERVDERHLLLGALRQEENDAVRILADNGITYGALAGGRAPPALENPPLAAVREGEAIPGFRVWGSSPAFVRVWAAARSMARREHSFRLVHLLLALVEDEAVVALLVGDAAAPGIVTHARLEETRRLLRSLL